MDIPLSQLWLSGHMWFCLTIFLSRLLQDLFMHKENKANKQSELVNIYIN